MLVSNYYIKFENKTDQALWVRVYPETNEYFVQNAGLNVGMSQASLSVKRERFGNSDYQNDVVGPGKTRKFSIRTKIALVSVYQMREDGNHALFTMKRQINAGETWIFEQDRLQNELRQFNSTRYLENPNGSMPLEPIESSRILSSAQNTP